RGGGRASARGRDGGVVALRARRDWRRGRLASGGRGADAHRGDGRAGADRRRRPRLGRGGGGGAGWRRGGGGAVRRGEMGARAPFVVDGRVWGVMAAGGRLPADVEDR